MQTGVVGTMSLDEALAVGNRVVAQLVWPLPCTMGLKAKSLQAEPAPKRGARRGHRTGWTEFLKAKHEGLKEVSPSAQVASTLECTTEAPFATCSPDATCGWRLSGYNPTPRFGAFLWHLVLAKALVFDKDLKRRLANEWRTLSAPERTLFDQRAAEKNLRVAAVGNRGQLVAVPVGRELQSLHGNEDCLELPTAAVIASV